MYFPPSEWERADCVSRCECSPDRPGYPGSCINPNEWVQDPEGNVYQAASYGIFQILDAVWDPSKNPNSPFTPEQWAMVMDPNVNTWMASVIWSRSGWIAWPGTTDPSGCCYQCDACSVAGGAIPYPDGPVLPPGIVPADIVTAGGAGTAVFGMGALLVALMLLPVGK